MSGVASEMEERKGKEDSAMVRGGGAIRKFHPEKNFLLPFSRRGDPGISGSRSRRSRASERAVGGGRGRTSGELTSGRGIPTLLAVASLLIANKVFQGCNEQRKNIWTADIFDISAVTFAVIPYIRSVV